jgi:hypothetical protein
MMVPQPWQRCATIAIINADRSGHPSRVTFAGKEAATGLTAEAGWPALHLAMRRLHSTKCCGVSLRVPGRSKPAGLIRPAHPALVSRPPVGPEWIHEVNHDGYRLIARKHAGRVVLWTRHGTDFTDRLPRIAEGGADQIGAIFFVQSVLRRRLKIQNAP